MDENRGGGVPVTAGRCAHALFAYQPGCNSNSVITTYMPLTKPQVIEAIAQKTSAEKKTVEAILDCLAQLAYQNAKDEFTVPGIGKLVVVDRKARMARNPLTGAQIQVPAKKALKFRIAKAAKDAVFASTTTTPQINSSTAPPSATI
jgi:DNA-binding protein HU-beta